MNQQLISKQKKTCKNANENLILTNEIFYFTMTKKNILQ